MSPADIVHTRVGTKEAGSEGGTEGGRMVEEGNECVWLVVAARIHIIHCTDISTEAASPFRVSQQNVNNEAEGTLSEGVMCVI